MFQQLQELRTKRARGEGGFTLVELLVVVIIITVISAIAVPIYLGQRGKANDAKMESDLSAIASLLTSATSTKSPVTFTENGSTLATASNTDAGLRTVTVDGTIAVTGFASGEVPSGGDCATITREDGAEGAFCLPTLTASGGDGGTGDGGTGDGGTGDGGTTPEPLTLTYGSSAFTVGSNNQVLSPTVSGGTGGSQTFALTSGALPAGVTFDTGAGTFTGPASSAWNFVATQVTAGDEHTCALANDGTVRCWGGNQYGQLNGTANSPASATSPQLVPNISNATQISAGQFHTCARLSNGTVKCWGRNNQEQLGGSSTTTAKANLSGVTEVSSGYEFTCALLTNGSVTCWGASNDIQQNQRLGGPGFPEMVTGVSTATDIDAGAYHTCARLSNARVICWGLNEAFQLGNSSIQYGEVVGTNTSSGVLNGVTSVVAGEDHSCALLNTGTIRCWGNNNMGQLGNGLGLSAIQNHQPVVYNGQTPVTNVAAVEAGEEHTCATFNDGTVRCWGRGGNGRLGTGTTSDINWAPTNPVADLSGVQNMGAGRPHTCAVATGGKVWCWGQPALGRLGHGSALNVAGNSSTTQHTPVATLRTGPQDGFPTTVEVTVTENGTSASTPVILSVS